VSWSNEGQPVAQWLAERGITAFILKYRTKPTPRDNAGYAAFVRDQIARSQSPDRRFSPLPPEAEADAKQAIRYVRQHAGRFGVDAQRVGFLGFSAGAVAGVSVATSADPADRPNFLGAIYGPLFPRVVPKSPPPLFAARALDDPLYHPLEKSLDDSFGLLAAWRANGGSVELHLYSSGGHGFGMQKNGATSELWIEQFFEWMKAQGLMWRIGTPGQ
jgi:acetyl esterase/lipase